jgi:hypothetical protein
VKSRKTKHNFYDKKSNYWEVPFYHFEISLTLFSF